MLRFSGAGVCDVGRVRPHNEDSAFVAPYVALVADGVGGAVAGEVASASAAYVVAAMALRRFGEDPADVLRQGVLHARLTLRRAAQQDPRLAGMATTLTAVACDGTRVVLGHVGDSRSYLFRDGELRQVTRDHTYVQGLVDRGLVAAAEAPGHQWSNVVLRSLDTNPATPLDDLDLVELDAVAGDRLLLCSDGLTDLVQATRIAELMRLADPASTSAILVQEALLAGGRDNITCVVLDVVDAARVVGDGRLLGALGDPVNVVDPAAVSDRALSAAS